MTVPNRAPVPLAAIPDGEVHVDSPLVIDAADHFADPDGDDARVLGHLVRPDPGGGDRFRERGDLDGNGRGEHSR